MLGHCFWNKENQCWLQNLHCHCGNDKNKIIIMTKDKKEAIFIRRLYKIKVKQKSKESQNSSAATGFKKNKIVWTSLVVQWLKFCASNAEGHGFDLWSALKNKIFKEGGPTVDSYSNYGI